ncbi:bacterial Ig-like domain-containing protein, partial [Christensenella hongkongensis]|uniref:bacterial Ig-like domain-containing protein n=1 Tax=Christensenella hongkongensis TaxID=270498 RepID=UPI0006230EF4
VLDSIEVTENPTKTTYTVGDTFDAAGLEITAHYTNGGADKVLTSGEYTLSTPDMSTAGTKTVTVTYEESGIEKTATFSITVNAPAPVLDSIEVTENPTKTTYTVGDTFDAAGLEITAHYTNGGADKVLTSGEYTLSTPDM